MKTNTSLDMLLYPVVILLTHRRGAAFCVLKSKDQEKESDFFIRTLGQTAENLLDNYCVILKRAQLKANDVKTLAVGTGPGSFTGLRLGCAFANGVKLALNCDLISLKTHLNSYFLQENYFSSEEDLQEFKNQLGEINLKDDSSGFVTYYDMQDAVEQIKRMDSAVSSAKFVDILYPNYGRDPTPVIKFNENKLKELQKNEF